MSITNRLRQLGYAVEEVGPLRGPGPAWFQWCKLHPVNGTVGETSKAFTVRKDAYIDALKHAGLTAEAVAEALSE
jgi:hypothetical protein